MKKILFILSFALSFYLNAQDVKTSKSDYFSLSANVINQSPADATTYYFNDMSTTANTSTANRVVYCPFNGVVTDITISVNCSAGASAESATIGIWSGTTAYNCKTDFSMNTNIASYVVSGLNIPVTAGGNFIFYFITPTWVTNPTSNYLMLKAYIKKN